MPYRTCPVPAAQHGHAPGQLKCAWPVPAALVRHGHVRCLGVSHCKVWQFVKAPGIAERPGLSRFEFLQAYYTVPRRDLDCKHVVMLASEGLGLTVWNPLANRQVQAVSQLDQRTVQAYFFAIYAKLESAMGASERVCGMRWLWVTR